MLTETPDIADETTTSHGPLANEPAVTNAGSKTRKRVTRAEAAALRNRDLVWIRCDEVVVPPRHRKKLHNIDKLAENMKLHGCLSSIVISPERMLLVGERRVTAAKQAGLDQIPAIVADLLCMQNGSLLVEIAENFDREDPDVSDVADMAEELEPLASQAARQRMEHKVTQEPGKTFSQAGKAIDILAAYFHMSGPRLRMAMRVNSAANDDVARFGDIREKMDATRAVKPAYDELRRRLGLLLEKPQKPDRFPGVSISTNRKGQTSIRIDREDGDQVLNVILGALQAYEDQRDAVMM